VTTCSRKDDAVATIIGQQQPVANDTEQSEVRPAVGDETGAASLDKVRDILFGGQMRDLDRRFARVEERLSSETADLKEDLRRRLAALEQFARIETETLLQRIKAEHDERQEATAGVSREVQSASTTLDKKIGLLDDQFARAQRELRQQILEMHRELADDIRDKIDAVLARLSREAGDLRSDKADRVTLAALFTEMAMRLTHEPPAKSDQE
jgi:DNA-binding transcriptional regulator YbjK